MVGLAIMILMLTNTANAQYVRLEGTVKCSTTGEALTNALVRVGSIFSYTNQEGEFILQVPEKRVSTLEVFHMGYDTYSTKGQDSIYAITLDPVEPDTHDSGLASGEQIMRQVFSRLHMNYELEDQLMLAYYKEQLNDHDNRIDHFAEGIIQVHIPSDVEKGPALVRPLKTRVKAISNIEHGGLYAKSGHATEMVESSIWAFNSFLSKKYRWDYDYNLVGTEVHRNENIFIIDFEPKGKKGNVAGRLWVDELSFAIIRVEYALVTETDWDSEVWIEEYQHLNHTYYLMRASFEGKWTENGIPYVFNSMLVNTSIELNKKSIPWEKFMLGHHFSFLLEDHGNFKDDYWGSFNYIKLTEEERAQLR